MTEELWKNWRIQTDFLILETEFIDAKYRFKNPNHKCPTWSVHTFNRWFCDHLVVSRKRNSELQKKWFLNFLDMPEKRYE